MAITPSEGLRGEDHQKEAPQSICTKVTLAILSQEDRNPFFLLHMHVWENMFEGWPCVLRSIFENKLVVCQADEGLDVGGHAREIGRWKLPRKERHGSGHSGLTESIVQLLCLSRRSSL